MAYRIGGRPACPSWMCIDSDIVALCCVQIQRSFSVSGHSPAYNSNVKVTENAKVKEHWVSVKLSDRATVTWS